MYNVIRVSTMGDAPSRRRVSGPHTWPVAWRNAAALNVQARRDFAEGRVLYDVPEYVAERATD